MSTEKAQKEEEHDQRKEHAEIRVIQGDALKSRQGYEERFFSMK